MSEKDIKTRLRDALAAHGLNPSSLAKQAGVNQKTLNNQINAETSLSVSTILLAMKAMSDVRLDWLFTGDGEMSMLNQNPRPSAGETDENLYHCTDNAEDIVKILKGIKPQYSVEDLSWLGGTFEGPLRFMAYPMFCMCDIPYNRLPKHKKKHGQYVIGFQKKWAIDTGKLTPIVYVHKNSVTSTAFTKVSDFLFGECCHNNNGVGYNDARDGIVDLSYLVKQYEVQEGERYYDEKEWRWTLPRMEGVKGDFNVQREQDEDPDNESGFKAMVRRVKESRDCKEYQEQINVKDDINMPFTLKNIATIAVPKNEEEKFKKLLDANSKELEYLGNIEDIKELVNNFEPSKTNQETPPAPQTPPASDSETIAVLREMCNMLKADKTRIENDNDKKDELIKILVAKIGESGNTGQIEERLTKLESQMKKGAVR